MTIMFPRGLAAAVLASLPLTMGIPNSELFPEISFIVILSSILVTTIGVVFLKKRKKPSRYEYS